LKLKRPPWLVPAVVAGLIALSFAYENWERNARAPYATIGRANQFTFYEGLPHQKLERDVLQAELKTKKTVGLHGFPFYPDPLELTSEDAIRIKTLLGDAQGFNKTPGGETDCSPFHPDYLVEWTLDGKVYRCLICFGCREVLPYGPRGDVTWGMKRDLYDGLHAILLPYRKNRPAWPGMDR
jgi:hypothetical protein